jgi:MIP family channel proteins
MAENLGKAAVAEAVGTFTLIFLGAGSILVDAFVRGAAPFGFADLVGIALAHGLALVVMISATWTVSGGHLNPAVTFGLWIGGVVKAKDAVVYWIAQLVGAVVAAAILLAAWNGVAGGNALATANHLGTPGLSPGVGVGAAILLETVATFFLVFVVYGTAVNASFNGRIGGIAIGLTVAGDILAIGPLTGAAMNVARWFGPALVSGTWTNGYVYVVGPLLGAAIAGLLYGRYILETKAT